jgi:hypothetical protein
MTKIFNEIVESPVSWFAGGLLSCVIAHAVMIPTGIEQWLHTAFSTAASPDIAASVDQILDLSQ